MSAIQEIFGWIGTALTMSFFISPVVPFINVFKGKLDYEDTPTIIISTGYCNCLVWYVYGILVNSQQIKTCNMIGCGASLLLIIIYLAYEVRKYLVDAILNALILFTGSWAAYRALTIIINDPNIIGKICVCTTLVVFISPLYIVFRVTKEKNYQLIPIVTAVFSILSGACWVVYGLMKKDFYVAGPNCMGVIVGALQCFIWQTYKKKYPTIGDAKEIATIGIESESNPRKTDSTSIKIDDDKDDENIQAKPVKISSKSEEVK